LDDVRKLLIESGNEFYPIGKMTPLGGVTIHI